MVRGRASFVCGLLFLLLFCFLLFFFDVHKLPSSYGTHVARWFGTRNVQFFVVAARLFLVSCVCLNFDDLAKQWRKMFRGVSEVVKKRFLCLFLSDVRLLLGFLFFSAAIAPDRQPGKGKYRDTHKDASEAGKNACQGGGQTNEE